MKDGTFQRHLNQLAAAKQRYLRELKLCEDEYERRFGCNPSNVDDDFWLDATHLGGGDTATLTILEVTDNILQLRERGIM